MSEWVNLDVVDGLGPVAVNASPTPGRGRPLDPRSGGASRRHGIRASSVSSSSASPPDTALLTHFVGTHRSPPPPVRPSRTRSPSLPQWPPRWPTCTAWAFATEQSIRPMCSWGRPVDQCSVASPGPRFPKQGVDVAPTAADDVAAIGRLMAQLLAGHDGWEPIPNRRSLRRRRWAGYRQRALLTLADHCQADDPAVRPSAASLAATIADVVSDEPRAPGTATPATGRASPVSTGADPGNDGYMASAPPRQPEDTAGSRADPGCSGSRGWRHRAAIAAEPHPATPATDAPATTITTGSRVLEDAPRLATQPDRATTPTTAVLPTTTVRDLYLNRCTLPGTGSGSGGRHRR